MSSRKNVFEHCRCSFVYREPVRLISACGQVSLSSPPPDSGLSSDQPRGRDLRRERRRSAKSALAGSSSCNERCVIVLLSALSSSSSLSLGTGGLKRYPCIWSHRKSRSS